MDKILEQVLLENNKAIAERDARIKELEAGSKLLKEQISKLYNVATEAQMVVDGLSDDEEDAAVKRLTPLPRTARIEELEAELSRIKEGAERLPFVTVQREHIDMQTGIVNVIFKSDLDKLMKSGNNVDPTSPLTIGAGVVPLTIGDGISPLTIDERR